MTIDWDKAPKWAVAHGLHETGFGIKEFWLGESQHQNLEHEKSFPYGGGDPSRDSYHNSRRESFSYVTERPSAWNGEGTPPAGTDCEAKVKNSGAGWKVYKVLAVESEYLIASCDAEEIPIRHQYWDFRPIRTAEQIAAEQREYAITDMCVLLGKDASRAGVRAMAGALFDAGYRKQVAQ